MTTQKQPEPGEYWQHKIHTKDRAYFIGRTPEGEMVWQCEGDTIECGNMDWSGWQHLPDCDSWTWQPDPFPHYYESLAPGLAYARRDSETTATVVGKDGYEFPDSWYATTHQGRTRITEAEALARVTPHTPEFCAMCGVHSVIPGTAGCKDCTEYALDQVKAPQESPDDWVTQDRVPPRLGIDFFRWVNRVSAGAFNQVETHHRLGVSHGWIDPSDGLALNVRCRRKDLPPLPSPKRVPVDIIATVLGNVLWRNHGACLHKDDRFIFSDNNGGWYVEVQP